MGELVSKFIGKKFGKLLIKNLYSTEYKNTKSIRWIKYILTCECDCGNIININLQNFRRKNPKKHCGCVPRKLIIPTHFITHNKSKSPEYKTWLGIKGRCGHTEANKRTRGYKNYAGRGIKVCEKWKYSFSAFFNDMGERPSKLHSIERIDNNGNYEPSNCKWATREEQSKNRRMAFNCHKIEYRKEVKSLQKWCYDLNLNYQAIFYRIKYKNMSFEEAISDCLAI